MGHYDLCTPLIYILKELLDNAIDADEISWTNASAIEHPTIDVRVEYIELKQLESQQLFITVRNQTNFPTKKLIDIFDPDWYTSRKAFFKSLTRGAMGNALKTILGIPYALRYRATHNWDPDLKPLRIKTSGTRFEPKYIVDAINRELTLDIVETDLDFDSGTEFSVGIDQFLQEFPRTVEQIMELAFKYRLCNPHVRFSWRVEIGEEEWVETFPAEDTWKSKFQALAPISWYSPEAFRHLLGAIFRDDSNRQNGKDLDAETVATYFSSLTDGMVHDGLKHLDIDAIDHETIESSKIIELYQCLVHRTPSFDSLELGFLGEESIKQCLPQFWDIDGEIGHLIVKDDGYDPHTPFVIEVAAAWLKSGKRQIISAINFAPTYIDPFLSSYLHTPIAADERVLGLRGILDRYGIDEETPFFLFLHIICPNVEHNEFSKTQINHLPFKLKLGEIINEIIELVRQSRDEAALQLEKKIKEELQRIIDKLDGNELYVPEQLYAKLRVVLSGFPEVREWLNRPESESRIRTIVSNHLISAESTIRPSGRARSTTGIIVMPSHPSSFYSIPPDHFSVEAIKHHKVNKILFVQNRELEPVVLENNWLSLTDMALMRNPSDQSLLRDMILRVMNSTQGTSLKLIILRNSDDQGTSLVENILKWIEENGLEKSRVIDLAGGLENVRLLEMMPGELLGWLDERWKEFGISPKCIPPTEDIRRGIGAGFETQLLKYLWSGVSQQLSIPRLLNDLDRELGITEKMMEEKLDEKLTEGLLRNTRDRSYKTALNEIVDNFLDRFIDEYRDQVEEIAIRHIEDQRNE
jgi:DNA topoisomerase VI subunit B